MMKVKSALVRVALFCRMVEREDSGDLRSIVGISGHFTLATPGLGLEQKGPTFLCEVWTPPGVNTMVVQFIHPSGKIVEPAHRLRITGDNPKPTRVIIDTVIPAEPASAGWWLAEVYFEGALIAAAPVQIEVQLKEPLRAKN